MQQFAHMLLRRRSYKFSKIQGNAFSQESQPATFKFIGKEMLTNTAFCEFSKIF